MTNIAASDQPADPEVESRRLTRLQLLAVIVSGSKSIF
jgi:hypothetical protein